MSYVEQIMGDNERVVYRTRQHFIVLLQRLFTSLFTFLVFLVLGLAVLIPPAGAAGDQVRFVIGVIALGSLVMPLYLIVSAWLQGSRGRDFVVRIWGAVVAGLAILAFALVMMLLPSFRVVGWIAIVVAVIPAAEAIRITLDWVNERYIITNRRVIEIKGTINKQVSDSALEKVNDVELTQSVVGRMLDYGTVQIITGSDIGVNLFRRISGPLRFKRAMLNAKEGLHEPSPPAKPVEESPPSLPAETVEDAAAEPDAEAASGIPDLIAELAELHEQGILSEEEFESKKKELLDRL
jgi:hypothetical protein